MRLGRNWHFDKDRENFFSCHAHTFSHGRYTQVLLGRLESKSGDIRFGFPDADVINIFRIEKVGE